MMTRQGSLHRLLLSLFHVLIAASFLVVFNCTSAAGQETASRLPWAKSEVFASRDFSFQNERLRDAIDRVAQPIRLNIVYHISTVAVVDKTNVVLVLENVTAPAAIDAL